MDGRKFGATAAIIVLGIGARLYFRSDDSKQIRSEATKILQTMDCYKANEKVIDEMADNAHEKAFSEAYDVGTGRRGSKFDENKYIKIFFQSMVDQARLRHRDDLKDALMGLKQVADCCSRRQGAA